MAKGKSVKDPNKAKKDKKGKEKPKKSDKSEKAEKGQKKGGRRPDERKGMRVIVRVLGTDLDGEKGVQHALLKVKGISYSMAKAICKVAKIDPKKKLGSFTESEISQLEDVLREPAKFGVPSWTANRRRDIETGADMHVTSTDVEVRRKFDVKRMIDKKSYKGVRHMHGLPVRGQRTKSSFRKGKTVGVVRKSARIQQAGSGKGKKKS
jgi:small subunit ribosomal protein S13